MGITEYNNYLKNKRDDIMKEAQRPSDKEAKKIYEIEKTMALTVFKKYWPDVVIDFKEAEVKDSDLVDVPTEEELNAIALEAARLKAEALFDKKLAEEKADKKAELEAQLKALDES